jgi:hypothetical protein
LKLVRDCISGCDTGLIQGLSLQVIAKMNRIVKNPVLVQLKHHLLGCTGTQNNPYLQPEAARALYRALNARGTQMTMNSCLRTVPQQWLIWNQYQQGRCGITLAARPDRSNHGGGLAIDIEDAYGWQAALEAEGWQRLGDNDPMHFDFVGTGREDLNWIQIAAFQGLWNQNNPGKTLAVDGLYGEATGNAISNSPADGWGNGNIYVPLAVPIALKLEPLPESDRKVFDKALEFTLQWEGGQANHVDDLGGRTNRGITQATYDQWTASQGEQRRDVFGLTLDQAMLIYKSQYWQLGALSEQLHDALEVVHFDTCVMHGVTGGVIFLQELFGLLQDGVYGPKTQAALLANNNLQSALKYCDNRIAYRYRRCQEDGSQRTFLEGWLNRDKALKDYAQKV